MALQDVVDFLRQDFTKSGCKAPVLFTKKFVAENASPPRVVVVPTTDRFLPPLQVGAVSPHVGQNPRSYMRRLGSAEVHIWAGAETQPNGSDQLEADYQEADRLVNQTIMSLYRAAFNSMTFDGGDWSQAGVYVTKGVHYLLKITVEFPIVDVPYLPDTGKTYEVVSGVSADITVDLENPSPPPGTMKSISFTTKT